MPTFEIPDGPVTAKVSGDVANPKGPRSGSAVFNVTNKSDETRSGRLSVQTAGEAKKEWFKIEGDQERKFGAGETQTAAITIAVPPEVPAGDYSFRLRIVAVNDPDNDHTDGPASTAQVQAPIKTGGIPAWVWIVVALVVLAAVGAGLYFFLKPDDDGPKPPIENKVEADAEVPLLEGESLGKAKELAAEFELTPVPGTPEGKAPDTIVKQAPPAGQRLTKGFPIRVTFDPGVTVPALTGNTDQAVRALAPLKLHVASSTSRCQPSGTIGEIVDQSPKAGTKVASGTGVDIFVRTRSTNPRIACGLRFQGVIRAEMLKAGPVGVFQKQQ